MDQSGILMQSRTESRPVWPKDSYGDLNNYKGGFPYTRYSRISGSKQAFVGPLLLRVFGRLPDTGVCGSRTAVIPACASPRPSVTVKKKPEAETAGFMLVAEAPLDLMCS